MRNHGFKPVAAGAPVHGHSGAMVPGDGIHDVQRTSTDGVPRTTHRVVMGAVGDIDAVAAVGDHRQACRRVPEPADLRMLDEVAAGLGAVDKHAGAAVPRNSIPESRDAYMVSADGLRACAIDLHTCARVAQGARSISPCTDGVIVNCVPRSAIGPTGAFVGDVTLPDQNAHAIARDGISWPDSVAISTRR